MGWPRSGVADRGLSVAALTSHAPGLKILLQKYSKGFRGGCHGRSAQRSQARGHPGRGRRGLQPADGPGRSRYSRAGEGDTGASSQNLGRRAPRSRGQAHGRWRAGRVRGARSRRSRARSRSRAGMGELNVDEPEDRQIGFRMGINVGDIVLEDGDIFGDGVKSRRASRPSPSPAASASPATSTIRSRARSPSALSRWASTRSKTSPRRSRSTACGPLRLARPPHGPKHWHPTGLQLPCCRSKTSREIRSRSASSAA